MYHFTECDLNIKSVAQLKDVYSQIGCTVEVADKRVKAHWVQAILAHQSAQIELVAVAQIAIDEQAVAQTELETHIETQAETIAPEITTVEITFYDHEVYAQGKQIASITHDPDDFQTQRWVVMVGETEMHRAEAWAKCFDYVRWHYKQGTLPVAPNAQAEVERAIPGYDFCCSQGIEFKQRTGSETGTTYWYAEANHYYNQPDRQYKTGGFEKLENAVKAAVDYLGKCGVDVVEVKQQIVNHLRSVALGTVTKNQNATGKNPATPDSAMALLTNSQSPNLSTTSIPEIEVDSDIDADFGVLYRVWAERTLLGTFYHAAADDKWVAQPSNSDDRPRCNTAAEAQLMIVAQAGLLVADTADEDVDLLDKPFDELTAAEWQFLAQQAMQAEMIAA